MAEIIAKQKQSTKQCSTCRNKLPADAAHFQRDRHNPDGLTYNCKACRSAARVARYRRNPEKERSAQRRRNAAIRDQNRIRREAKWARVAGACHPMGARDGAIVAMLAEGATLKAIADEFGLTRQRVQQIVIKCCGEQNYRELRAA